MIFNLNQSLPLLEATPTLLSTQLGALDESWVMTKERPELWSVFDVLGHLVHGEKTDWLTRLQIILKEEDRAFEPFDRFAQYQDSIGKSLADLLEEFRHLRQQNIKVLKSLDIQESHYHKTGRHPALGTVSLKNLLATWVVHDLNHLSQINRIMAKQYQTEVGPWQEYLRILNP